MSISKNFQIRLQTIAENEQRVYESGKAYGETVGRKAEHDETWDGIQQNGNRTAYMHGFCYWGDKGFYPKYDINPSGSAVGIFYGSKIVDLKQRLIDCGVTLDTSDSTSLQEAFANCTVLTRVPTINATSSTNIQYMFSYCRELIEVEKIVLKDNGTQSLLSAFNTCTNLIQLTIEGVIGHSNGVNLQHSTKLSKASIISVINALSTTTSGLTATFSKTAVETAFGSTTSTEWLALVATKSNWTISLL